MIKGLKRHAEVSPVDHEEKLQKFVASGGKEASIKMWDAIKEVVTPNDLRIKATEGFNKGKTVLWKLGWLFSNGKTEPLIEAWEKFGVYLNIEDFRVQAQADPYKGQSLFWLLSFGLHFGDAAAELWDKVMTQFGHDLRPEDLLVYSEAGKHKGKTVVSLIAQHAHANPNIAAFLLVRVLVSSVELRNDVINYYLETSSSGLQNKIVDKVKLEEADFRLLEEITRLVLIEKLFSESVEKSDPERLESVIEETAKVENNEIRAKLLRTVGEYYIYHTEEMGDSFFIRPPNWHACIEDDENERKEIGNKLEKMLTCMGANRNTSEYLNLLNLFREIVMQKGEIKRLTSTLRQKDEIIQRKNVEIYDIQGKEEVMDNLTYAFNGLRVKDKPSQDESEQVVRVELPVTSVLLHATRKERCQR